MLSFLLFIPIFYFCKKNYEMYYKYIITYIVDSHQQFEGVNLLAIMAELLASLGS